MSDAESTVWVVFNGEIYNFKELRACLEKRGHQFRTQSDTEVIVHGYKEWGTDILNHLNGMFGLAIWDAPKQRMVIARDAMGIKPLYYQIAGEHLYFGSEIRAVAAAGATSPDVDPRSLFLFLRYRYTPSPLTISKGIRKLAPGKMLIAERGCVREERWYNYVPVPFPDTTHDADAAEELLSLYRGAVARHLLSDVPVGILLSGGIDSGLLLALMNEHRTSWQAYTAGFGTTFEDDELAEAAESAAILNARHVPVQLHQRDFEQALPRIVAALEEPIASSSVVPMYFLSARARQDVKVVIIGQGPDELFGGYKRHLGVHYGQAWRRLPGALRSLIGTGIAGLPRNATLKRGVESLGVEDRLTRYQHVFSLAPVGAIENLFRDDLVPEIRGADLADCWRDLVPQMAQLDELGGFQMIEIRSSLPDELLMYADKLTMAHGLEGRVPYLDRTVVEFAQRLGATLKIRNGNRKWLHLQVCKKFLPARITRRKKRGFAVNVVDSWFNSSSGVLAGLLLDPEALIFDLLKPARVRKLLDEHKTGRRDNHKLLFSLVMFEQWLRQHRSSPAATVALGRG
jgi:asparagine synthase (glutamine-hydrolysing)